jgi:cyclophilin family peptidyl-prolyl cis-trans isomerase
MDLRALIASLLTVSLVISGCVEPEGGDDDGNGGGGGLAFQAPVISSAGCTSPGAVELDHPQPVVTLVTNFGEIDIEVFADLVPVTAQNFLELVEAGFYDGTRFHRIIRDFMMQGGNPATADPPRPQAARVQDEFHHRLRHDSAGVVSMANAGPNTGTSQFFITFGPTRHLDDGHSVFGRVVRGMETVQEVNQEASSPTGEPAEEVVLESAFVTYPEVRSNDPVELGLWTPKSNLRVAADGGRTAVLLVAVSCTDRLVPVNLTVETPEGVTATVEPGFSTFDLPAAQRLAATVTLESQDGAAGTSPVTVVLTGPGGASARLELQLERASAAGKIQARLGDSLTAHYVGVLVDGRMFDTSYATVAASAEAPKASTFSNRPRGDPFTFVPGQGVVQGFTDLAVGLDEGATAAGRMPPEKAYGHSGHALAGRTLIFLLEAVDIERA